MGHLPDDKLATVGSEVPRLNLGVTLRSIRDGRPVVEKRRDDINAIAAIFIEETWRSVEEWIHAHGTGLPLKRGNSADPSAFAVAPRGELLTRATSDEIIEVIRLAVLKFLDSHVAAWSRSREARRLQPPAERSAEDAHLDDLYVVYYRVVTSGKQASSAIDPRAHVSSGLHTAVNTLLNFLKVIPHTYRGEFGPAPIDRATCRMIAEQSRRAMITLASMQIAYFLNVDSQLKRAGADDYDPAKFQIIREMGYGGRLNFRMKVRDEILEIVKQHTTPRTAATGCPALVVQGGSGKSVIAAFFEWIMDIAEQQYFPNFETARAAAASSAAASRTAAPGEVAASETMHAPAGYR
jgi:hypothetical protein